VAGPSSAMIYILTMYLVTRKVIHRIPLKVDYFRRILVTIGTSAKETVAVTNVTEIYVDNDR
jgi:hypothetical protein